MRASTGIVLTLICLLGLAPQAVCAALPRVGIAPFAHEVPNIRSGLARLFTQELEGNGRVRVVPPSVSARVLGDNAAIETAFSEGLSTEQAEALAREMDYVLLGRATAFGMAAKDKPIDHSRDLNDWGRLTSGDSEVAQAYFELRLIDLRSGVRVLDTQVEGLESRKGTRLRHISYGWMGTVDLATDSFRSTTLGRASYKALGAFLYELYPHFPLTGEVLAVAGDSVVIDIDSRAGVAVGDELAIFQQSGIRNTYGELVFDRELRIAGAQVIEIQPGRCLCLLLDGAGSVAEGDLARPLEERWLVPEETEVQP